MRAEVHERAWPWIAWSRIFSPLTPDEWREDAWTALRLPSTWHESSVDFWSVFQMGLPSPAVPLVLHAALGRDGGPVREDWMRVVAHLGLAPRDTALPPDHLAPACEILAYAVDQDDPVLVHELCARYLLPWCRFAQQCLAGHGDAVGEIPGRFLHDLETLDRLPETEP